jgi:hypothetical protein
MFFSLIAGFGIPIEWAQYNGEVDGSPLTEKMREQRIVHLLRSTNSIPRVKPSFIKAVFRAALHKENRNLYNWLFCEKYDRILDTSFEFSGDRFRFRARSVENCNVDYHQGVDRTLCFCLIHLSKYEMLPAEMALWMVHPLCLLTRYTWNLLSCSTTEHICIWQYGIVADFVVTDRCAQLNSGRPQQLEVDWSFIGKQKDFNVAIIQEETKWMITHPINYPYFPPSSNSGGILSMGEINIGRKSAAAVEFSVTILHMLLKNLITRFPEVPECSYLFVTCNEEQFSRAKSIVINDGIPVNTIVIWTHMWNPKGRELFSLKPNNDSEWLHSIGSASPIYANLWLKPQIMENTEFRGYVDNDLEIITMDPLDLMFIFNQLRWWDAF